MRGVQSTRVCCRTVAASREECESYKQRLQEQDTQHEEAKVSVVFAVLWGDW